jgi:hypothetical protein
MKNRPKTIAILAVFVYTWLMVGFSTGTATILFPARWLTSALREHQVPAAIENLVMTAVIIVFIVMSAFLARALVRVTLQASRTPARFGVPMFVTVLAGFSLWAWMNPDIVNGAESEVTKNLPQVKVGHTTFVFGPYPTRERLRQLKHEHFTGDISLLHVAVMPFEPRLLNQELQNAKDVGIKFIHAPMLPWVGNNDASIDMVRDIARRAAPGKYYVHCYLGQDRTGTIKHVVETIAAEYASGEDPMAVRELSDRTHPFERGKAYELEDQIYLMPWLNRSEGEAYLAKHAVATVISLLDPNDPGDRQYLDEEKKWAKEWALHVIYYGPLPKDSVQREQKALQLVKVTLNAPLPVAVHALYSDPYRSRDIEAFLQAFKSVIPETSGGYKLMDDILMRRQ